MRLHDWFHKSHDYHESHDSHLTLSTNQKGLEKLETLDLLDCPLTRQEDYRAQVFALLPGLRSLDGLNQAGEEVEESDSEGEGQDNTVELLYKDMYLMRTLVKFEFNKDATFLSPIKFLHLPQTGYVALMLMILAIIYIIVCLYNLEKNDTV